MRIGIDVAQTCAERAGCAWFADGCARAIAAARPEDAIDLYHHFGDWINASAAGGVRIESPNVSSPLIEMDAAAARAFWASREGGEPLPGTPEIVISQSFHAPRTPGSKLIYTVFDLVFLTHPQFSTDATRLLCQRELLLALARADAFVFISEFTRREFEEIFPGWLAERGVPWTIAYPGCRFPRVSEPLPFREDSPWLFFGSLEPRKNPAAILDAYELHAASTATPRPLVLAGGRGWSSESIQQRISELGRRLPVRHAGYLSEPALMETMAASHALLFPSWHEGFGMPVLEAMNRGLPVITSHHGALAEAAGQAALIIDPANPQSIADAMTRLHTDAAIHQSLGRAGLAHSRTFGWDRTANAIISLFKKLETPRTGIPPGTHTSPEISTMEVPAPKKSPKLSIIIPCYNERLTIRNIVDAVRAAPVESKEIIIVDDCSKDGTREILSSEIEAL
ncbi:MAG TPA: glycosyltransferase, partial [Opitutaceae bacterium]